MIIITDAHVSKDQGNYKDFFKMLKSLEKNSQELVFLGDIFDLWIALSRYENDIHRNFIAWCHEQRHHRTIGYLEGNHEFYLADERGEAFSWCVKGPWRKDGKGSLFVHGDQINRNDRNYLIFRKLVRNNVTKLIIRYLPFGPTIAKAVKRGLKKTNNKFKEHLPRDEIEFFAESKFAEGIDIIFVGHFHKEYYYQRNRSKELYAVPDWYSSQKVTLFDRASRKVESVPWREVGN